MKIRRVAAALLDRQRTTPAAKAESPRERTRRELEAKLGEAVEGARLDASIAFRVTLDDGERASSVRAAFKRVKYRIGAAEVNLITVDGELYIVRHPQRRGRRPTRASSAS